MPRGHRVFKLDSHGHPPEALTSGRRRSRCDSLKVCGAHDMKGSAWLQERGEGLQIGIDRMLGFY